MPNKTNVFVVSVLIGNQSPSQSMTYNKQKKKYQLTLLSELINDIALTSSSSHIRLTISCETVDVSQTNFSKNNNKGYTHWTNCGNMSD